MSRTTDDITIARAIQTIARKGIITSMADSNAWIGNGDRTAGFVCKIHDDPEDQYFGTVDVREFNSQSVAQEDNENFGLHEHVYLSAIQNNSEGMVIIPKLYSEVIIAQDRQSQIEYVTMYSHVDVIQMDSHESVTIQVREREEFDDNEDGDDIDQLPLTGIEAGIHIKKDSITTNVVSDKDGKNTVTEVFDSNGTQLVVGDDKSSQTITQDAINLTHDKANLTLDNSSSTLGFDSSIVTVESGKVYVGSKSGTDDAVLGQQLASILSELVGYLSQMMTPTMMGPQPPASVLGSFIALKSKIQSFAASHSGFLTSKVQIQK